MPIRIQFEAEVQSFLETAAQPPFLCDLGLEKGRLALEEAQSRALVDRQVVDIEDLKVKDGPSGEIWVRILRPQSAPGCALPAIVYLHGPGWVSGSPRTHDRLARELAVGAQAAVVFPSYSRSPEAKYPTAIEECYSVVKWVAECGNERGLDPLRIAVAGDGAGGNLAAAVTILARERGGPSLRLQLLFYPVTDASFDSPSYQQFAEGCGLRRDEMLWGWNQYTTNPGERGQITASPLRASLEQLRGLPEALVITAEADVLRDEGEAYAGRLRAAGVRASAARFLGTIHDFVLLNDLAGSPAARGAMALAAAWLREGFAAT
jgi:acetyl esterase